MLLRSVTYNFLGLGLPLLVAVGTIPILVAELGTAGFGVLTIIWAFVSYFSLFDLGLGRAVTQRVAVALASGEREGLPAIAGTAYVLMALLGLLAALGLAWLTPWFVGQLQDVPDPAQTRMALYAMACGVPFVVLTSGFRGVLEAFHAFGVLNAIRVPMGIFTFLGPVLVLWTVGPDLAVIAWVLVGARVLACLAHWIFVQRVTDHGHRGLKFRRELVAPLFRQGGWMSVSNVVSPLMGYIDRFIIGIVISSTAIAWYVTPNEIVTRLWIIPGALTGVLFPIFAAKMITDKVAARDIFGKSIYWLFVAMLPVILVLTLFAQELLAAWIDPEFAENSYRILQLLAVGMLINILAHIPFTLIQGSGLSRTTAFIHLVQLPFYALGLYWLAGQYGILGVAAGWVARMVFDTLAMYFFALPLVGIRLVDAFSVRMCVLAVACAVGVYVSLGLPLFARLSLIAVVSLFAAVVVIRGLREAIKLRSAQTQ